MRPHSQAQWEYCIQAKLVLFSIDLFDFEDNGPFDAQLPGGEMNGLSYNSRPFWLNMLYLRVSPRGIICWLGQNLPYHLDGCRDGGSGTNGQPHLSAPFCTAGGRILLIPPCSLLVSCI